MDIPWQQLSAETLDNLLSETILREGTDYGEQELSLDTKKARLLASVKSGESVIAYDAESDSVSVVAG